MNDNNNIENSGSKGKNPFKTSTDYFESFNSKLQNRIDDFEEIKTLAPLLSNIPKYNPFEVPANYFDELPTIIQQHCVGSKPATSFIEWLKLIVQPRFAMPVITTILIAVAGINYMDKNATSLQPSIAEEVTTEEQLYNIDEATIIESLVSSTENKTLPDDNTNIEDYLIDNNIDENNLNNEL
jgi:hypothetical protein